MESTSISRKVFICSPFRPTTKDPDKRTKEQVDNARLAAEGCRKAVGLGFTPIAPHLFIPRFLNDEDEFERDIGIKLGLNWLEDCDELWVLGDHISGGMAIEIDHAKKLKKTIRIVRYLEIPKDQIESLLKQAGEVNLDGATSNTLVITDVTDLDNPMEEV